MSRSSTGTFGGRNRERAFDSPVRLGVLVVGVAMVAAGLWQEAALVGVGVAVAAGALLLAGVSPWVVFGLGQAGVLLWMPQELIERALITGSVDPTLVGSLALAELGLGVLLLSQSFETPDTLAPVTAVFLGSWVLVAGVALAVWRIEPWMGGVVLLVLLGSAGYAVHRFEYVSARTGTEVEP